MTSSEEEIETKGSSDEEEISPAAEEDKEVTFKDLVRIPTYCTVTQSSLAVHYDINLSQLMPVLTITS